MGLTQEPTVRQLELICMKVQSLYDSILKKIQANDNKIKVTTAFFIGDTQE